MYIELTIIVLDIQLPDLETIILTVVCTILLGVLSHGFSANPLVNFLAKFAGKQIKMKQ